ncbi:HAD family hydrolase [Candidatus Woesearchaeota archaeon]|nr:HAD family hydrolase [Candidatus Woesearchaeota archaeon]
MPIKAIGFDFDGTLIESEEEKMQEMAEMFRKKFGVHKGFHNAYIEIRKIALNRKQKIKKIFQNLLQREPTGKELKLLQDHFGKHYQRRLQTCPLFQCHQLVKELRKQVKFLFLLSLEEKKEVQQVARHCGIAQYFDEILGGPKGKVEHLLHIVKKHHLKPSEVMYVGDSHSDVAASKKAGIKVILVGKKRTYEQLKDDLQADFVLSNLCDVQKKIDGIQ